MCSILNDPTDIFRAILTVNFRLILPVREFKQTTPYSQLTTEQNQQPSSSSLRFQRGNQRRVRKRYGHNKATQCSEEQHQEGAVGRPQQADPRPPAEFDKDRARQARRRRSPAQARRRRHPEDPRRTVRTRKEARPPWSLQDGARQ